MTLFSIVYLFREALSSGEVKRIALESLDADGANLLTCISPDEVADKDWTDINGNDCVWYQKTRKKNQIFVRPQESKISVLWHATPNLYVMRVTNHQQLCTPFGTGSCICQRKTRVKDLSACLRG